MARGNGKRYEESFKVETVKYIIDTISLERKWLEK
jgi:hypothetical protein